MTTPLDFRPDAHAFAECARAAVLPTYRSAATDPLDCGHRRRHGPLESAWCVDDAVHPPAQPERSVQRLAGSRAAASWATGPIRGVVVGVIVAVIALVLALGSGSGAAADDPSDGTISPAAPAVAASASGESTSVASVRVHVVQPGETLWSIAAQLAPGAADLRPVVDLLRDAAGGSALDVGQRIPLDTVASSDQLTP